MPLLNHKHIVRYYSCWVEAVETPNEALMIAKTSIFKQSQRLSRKETKPDSAELKRESSEGESPDVFSNEGYNSAKSEDSGNGFASEYSTSESIAEILREGKSFIALDVMV